MAPRGTAPVERITYTDCVDWEQEADVTGVRDSDRLFWTAMLRSCGEGTPRSYPPRIEARRRTLPLPAKIEADIQSFLRQRGIGLNALFAERFLRVKPMDLYIQEYTQEFLYSLLYRDMQTDHTVLQILLDRQES